MSTTSLIINYSVSSSNATSASDTPYVRLEQVLPVEETATLGEVAEILENLYKEVTNIEINLKSNFQKKFSTLKEAIDFIIENGGKVIFENDINK